MRMPIDGVEGKVQIAYVSKWDVKQAYTGPTS